MGEDVFFKIGEPLPRPHLILWMLWSRDRSDRPTGVFSHQTALSLHELTDMNPARLDLTFPATFRRGVPIPKVLRLHSDNVPSVDRVEFFGVPVTNAIRTILDVWKEGSMPHADLREAFRVAVQGGAITRTQIEKCKEDPASAPILS